MYEGTDPNGLFDTEKKTQNITLWLTYIMTCIK